MAQVILGLGCDRNTPKESIERAIALALAQVGLSHEAVLAAATIDKKSDEAGLLAACEQQGWPLHFYTAEELSQIEVPNPSEVVRKYVGTPAVAEAAALKLAERTMESLLLEKYKHRDDGGKNATVSIVRI